MIYSKTDLRQCLNADAISSGRTGIKPKLFGDEIWKYQIVLRKKEFYIKHRKKSLFSLLDSLIVDYKFHRYSLKLGFSIPPMVFDEGLSLPHYGTIVVAKNAKVGKNCRLHEGVTIGATNGSNLAAQIGDNVFVGTGAKIIGNITIADNVAIGANAVVIKSILEPGTTWAGVPAKKVSDNGSNANIIK